MNPEQSNPYFKDLFLNTSDLIHFLTLEGNIELVNPAWLTSLGYSINEVQGNSIYSFICDEERALYETYRKQCIAHQIVDDIEIGFKRKNGERAILEGNIRPFYIDEKLIHTRGVFKDITFKRQKEKEREDEFIRINNFLKNAPDAVVVIDENQIVVEWNLKAEHIFGYLYVEAVNQPLSELIIPMPYREAHKRGMQHFLKTGEGPVLNKTIDVTAIDKNSREFPISLSISNVKLGQKWFFIAFMEDISDKKKQQEALIRQEIELEQVKKEDQRNRDFLNIASHELKTPLTGIKAFAQLALRGFEKNSKERTTEYLRKIDESSDKLKKLIFDLLDISRIQSGKLIVKKELIEYDKFLLGIIDNSQVIFPTHKILLKNHVQAQVNIDPIRIEQVLINLINNAVKYSPKSDLIEVTTLINNKMLITEVKDQGIGIPKNNQKRVFEKFYRVEELSKTDTSGLGIGLFIASEIIKQHKGSLWVQSNEGQGSTFCFALPIKDD